MSDQAIQEQGIQADPGSGDVRKKLHPGFKKNLVVIGGIFLAAIAVTALILFAVFSKEDVHGQSSMNLPPSVEQKSTTGASPQYQKLVTEKNVEDHKAAERNGSTFIPVIPDKPADAKVDAGVIAPVSPMGGSGPQVGGGRANGDASQGAPNASQSAASKDDIAHAKEAMTTLITQWHPKPPEQIIVASADMNEQKNSGIAAAQLTAPTLSGVVPVASQAAPSVNPALMKPENYSIYLLKPYAATLDKPIRTDIDPRTIVTVRSGPYNGAQLTGTATRTLEFVKTEFTDMYLNGKHYTVKAVGLDEATLSEAMDGDYNRELMRRHFLPLTFDILGTYANAEAQTGSTVVAGVGGALQSTPAPTSRQAMAAGLSAGLKEASSIASEDLPQPHVSKGYQATIAVMFTE